ncbi:MAG: hypothetical protein QM680_05275 [Luteolibacter sp.]
MKISECRLGREESMLLLQSSLAAFLIHADHPAEAEAIREHAEKRGSECFSEWHGDLAAFFQGVEEFFGFFRGGDVLDVLLPGWRCSGWRCLVRGKTR